MTTRVTHEVEGTRHAGADFAALLRPGDIVILRGDLGAGKTAFTQGVARGLGCTQRVTSPTFTICQVYELPDGAIDALLHIDLYRIGHAAELSDLGVDEAVDRGAVAMVEWGDLAPTGFGEPSWTVTLRGGDDDDREITIEPRDSARLAAAQTWASA
jgi:tRNA threonylcarbamoyladenosine biosynthesis protein TsaE